MTTKAERAKQLVELATNESAATEEARTAALTACKLIKSAKLRIVDDASEPRAAAEPEPSRWWQQATDAWAEEAVQEAKRRRTARNPKPSRSGGYETMRATDTGTCWTCKKWYLRGDLIARSPNKQWSHDGCFS